MLKKLQTAIKIRAAFLFFMIHFGLALGVYGLFRLSDAGVGQTTVAVWAGALLALYGSFVMAGLFVLIPAWPWLQRAQRLASWREWALQELPQLLAVAPILFQVLRVLKSLWREVQAEGWEKGVGRDMSALVRGASRGEWDADALSRLQDKVIHLDSHRTARGKSRATRSARRATPKRTGKSRRRAA